MVTEELILYIKSQLDAGVERDEIIKILKSQGGWERADIADAFAKIGQEKMSNNGHQKIGDELRKPSMRASSGSVVAGRQNDRLDKDALKAQGARGVLRVSAQTAQTAQEAHVPDSILGQATGQKKGSGGKKTVSVIITIIVLLGILAGVAYGYSVYFKNPKPLDLLLETIIKGAEVTAAKEKGNFEFGLNMSVNSDSDSAMQNFFTNDKTSFNYLVSYDMAYDISDAANQKIDGFLTFGIKGNMGFMTANFDGTVDMKMVDNVIYLQLRDTTPFMDYDLSEYEDRWIEIDLENIMPGIGIDIEELMAMQGEQKKEVEETLQKLLSNPEIVEIINRSGKVENATDANGNKEYHLTFQVSKEDWKILIKEVMATSKDLAIKMMEEEMQNTVTYPGYEEPSMEEMFAEIESNLESEEADKVFEILENLTLQMWIAKDTMLTRKSVMSLNAEGITIEDEYSGKMTIDVAFSGESETDYDVAVEVTPPTDAISLQEFIEEVMGESAQDQKETLIRSNLMSVRPNAELYYDTKGSNYGTLIEASEEACKAKNTMFADDESISFLLDSINNSSTDNQKMLCTIGSKGKSYAISAKISDDLWFCIDSAGASYETNLPLAEGDTVCPEEVDELLTAKNIIEDNGGSGGILKKMEGVEGEIGL